MYNWLLSSMFNYQLEPNVQLVIKQYVQLSARAQCTTGYSPVCSITSQSPMYNWLFSSMFNKQPEPNIQLVFSSILNYQPEPNVLLVIQQYVQLPARAHFSSGYSADFELPDRAQCTAGFSAVYATKSQNPLHSGLFSSMFNCRPEPNVQLVF